MKICCVCGARPNFMKVAALTRAFETRRGLDASLVHTGQHYDARMSRVMFEDLQLPHPDVHLGVRGGSHAGQTANVMQRFEPVLARHRPDLVLVVGDVNSTLACALVAAKMNIAVGHVEAGLRSGDRSMPEEINRVATDAVSDLLFASESSGVENLRREGVPDPHIHHVGNLMIDTLRRHRARAERSSILRELQLRPKDYAVATLHRPGNVDEPEVLSELFEALLQVGERLPVVLPAHPRTARRLGQAGLLDRVRGASGLRLLEPLGYLDFLRLLSEARLVLTDSGGVQEEATVLEVWCLTLRWSTERPSTVESGCNRLVGNDASRIVQAVDEVLAVGEPSVQVPELWDGRAGERLAEILANLSEQDLADLRSQRGGCASPRGGPSAVDTN